MLELNHKVFYLINDFGINSILIQQIFILFAVYSVPILALYLLFQWFLSKNTEPIILGSLTFISSEIFAKLVLSNLHFNYQPFYVLDNVNQLIEKDINNSFPSDHTILIFSFMLAFMYFSKKILFKISFILIALLVGVSRIGVGVHYPFDVLISILTVLSFLAFFIVVNKNTNINSIILSLYDNTLKHLYALLKIKKTP